MKIINVFGILFAFILLLSPLSVLAGDMISPSTDGGKCLTVSGTDLSASPTVLMDVCRGTMQQLWTVDSATGKWKTDMDDNYCLAADTLDAAGAISIRLCSDSRALALETNPNLAGSFRVVGASPVLVLDWGVYGKVALADQNGWDYQLFKWLQSDLDVVDAQGCAITYPLPVSDTAGYARELACDRVAKIQPPYAAPARDPAVWPGAVDATAPTVSRVFSFNLQFKDNSYMRISVPPLNWMSTGLYAPSGQIVTINVTGATSDELSDVYAQIGVHTDILKPTHENVIEQGQFKRYPNVTSQIRLQPGDNLVRSPYGGVIELISNKSVSKTIIVTISNAVQTPHFLLGSTTEADWLVQRTLPGAWAEFESDLAVLFVKSDDIRTLSYAEALGVAQYYRDIIDIENRLMAVSATDPAPQHQMPQGQHRFVKDIQISNGAAHAGYPQMFSMNYPMASPIATFLSSADMSWGNLHELGHNMQMPAWSEVYGVESTNNMFSLYGQERMFGTSRIADENNYVSTMSLLNDSSKSDKWSAADPWNKIVFMDQIRLGFPEINWDFYGQAYRRYRDMTSDEYNAISTDALKYDTFMKIMCDITNANLTPHFEIYTVPVTQAAKDYCAAKPALTRDIWLIDGAKPMWYHAGSGSGSFLREVWTGISGTSLSSLTSSPQYPGSPGNSSFLETGLEGVKDPAGNYGERLRAYLHPPVTGSYRFWLSGGDSAKIILSTNEDPANASPIVTLDTSSGYRNFDAFAMSVQRSGEIQLEEGRKYYIEVLHKESTGSHGVSVAWNIPAVQGKPGEVRKIIDAQYLSPYSSLNPPTTQSNFCQAVLSDTLLLTIPIIEAGNKYLWADLAYQPLHTAKIIFKLNNYGIVEDISKFSCTKNTLSDTLIIHIPEFTFANKKYWVELQYNTELSNASDIFFTVTKFGAVD